MLLSNFLLTIITISFTDAAALKPRYLEFGMRHYKRDQNLIKRLTQESLRDSYTYYMATIEVGSDQQSQDLLVDTGSNVLWVINSTSCSSCSYGTFTSSDSSTFELIDDSFEINYGSGEASGDWGTDSVHVGGSSVGDFRIGVASTYPREFGLIGLSYDNEDIGSSPSYPNLPKMLKNNGVINKVAYSFYAGVHGDNEGSLLFGAIDNSKYTGDLKYVSMESDSITVNISSVGLNSSSDDYTSENLFTSQQTLLVDTGTSFTSFPTDAFNKLIAALDATNDGGSYFVDCALLNLDVSLIYNFSGHEIKVPISDLLYQESAEDCLLGVFSTDSRLIFGGNAMRSVYAVFNLEDQNLGLAQANTDPGSEDIEVIS